MQSMRRVVIGGGSGFLGRAVTQKLENLGFEVIWVGRKEGGRCVTWDHVKNVGLPASEGVIQLAGAPIIDTKWDEHGKAVLRSSRVDTTNTLVQAMRKEPPKVGFVCASAMGIYPPDTGEEVDERTPLPPAAIDDNPPGTDGYKKAAEELYAQLPFAQALCREWEATARQELPASVRRTFVRVGIVLGPGGALQSMYWPFYLGGGGPMGSGKQAFPWIHIEDVAEMIVQAAVGEGSGGLVTAAAPEYVTQGQFATALGKAMWRPAIVPTPAFAVRLMFQDRAALLLDDVRMRARHLDQTLPGFKFAHPRLDEALSDVLSNWK